MTVVRTAKQIALILPFLLAACAEDRVQEAGPSESSSAAASAPSGSQAGQPAAAQQNPNWLDLSPCGRGPRDLAHYNVAGTEVSVPQGIVARLLLVEAPDLPPLDQSKPLAGQVEAGFGCPSRPFPVAGIVTRSSYETELLQGTVSLFPIPRGLTENYRQLITQLRDQQPTNACQKPEGDLLLCAGQERLNNEAENVLYVISTDPGATLAFGAPLFARCELENNQPVGCNLGDRANPAIFFDATLARLPRSTADLRAAHDAVRSRFASGTPGS